MASDSFLAYAVSCSLVDLLDQPLLVQLRDGRKLIGKLITFDQYSNIVLEGCVERHIHPPHYADEAVGSQILRGENIVLMGALRTRELKGMTATSVAEVKRLRDDERRKGGDDELRLKEDEDFAIY